MNYKVRFIDETTFVIDFQSKNTIQCLLTTKLESAASG